jgi:hypothetical protein
LQIADIKTAWQNAALEALRESGAQLQARCERIPL